MILALLSFQNQGESLEESRVMNLLSAHHEAVSFISVILE